MKFLLQLALTSSILIFLTIGITAWTKINSSIEYTPKAPVMSFYQLSATTLGGSSYPFDQLRGKRVLIVNTASRCGFTPQYEALETLHRNYGGEGFTILGFPCNDFGKQEPGTADEISNFCSENYGVTFQMMEKLDIQGEDRHGVYEWLCSKEKNGVANHKVAWNFHKFLVDENGQLAASLGSRVKPMDDEILSFVSGK